MEKLKLEDFLQYTYLSNLKSFPEGIFFVTKRAKEDQSGYTSSLWMLRDNKPYLLIKDSDFSDYTVFNNNVFFLKKDEKTKVFVDIYALPLQGGESYLYKKSLEMLQSLFFLSDNSYLALYALDKRLDSVKKEDLLKKAEENKNYEEITESPFYLNGAGYINARRTKLAIFNKDGKKDLFSDDYSVGGFSISEDKKKVLTIGTLYSGSVAPLTAEVREVDIESGEITTILESGVADCYGAEYCGGKIILALNYMDKYGVNQNADFYLYDNGKLEKLVEWGEALGDSVGTDIKLGGGKQSFSYGDKLYFITTLFHSSSIYSVSLEGKIKKEVENGGSINSLTIKDGKIYYIGLEGQKLQELYSENGAITSFNDEVLSNKYVAKPEYIEYENDGIQLEGWIIKPYGYKKGKKYPAILDIHGGPKTVYGTLFMHEMQLWASEGYFVFWTNPRGADGRGNDFADIRGKYGTIDYSDLMKFTDVVLASYPDIDKERIGETGGSYGGFMSNWILGHTDRFKAIATQRSIYNWLSFWGTSDIGPYFAQDQCGATISETDKLLERSPMLGILKNAKTPTLIIHSDKDYRCPVEQAYQLYSALSHMGVETRFILFHDETHELSRSGKPAGRIKRLYEITEWMNKHLK